MKAGNYEDYADFCRATDWMDPYVQGADEKAALEEAWEKFGDAYEKEHGELSDEDWDILRYIWEVCDEHSDKYILEMSIDEMIKKNMDLTFWYQKYRKDFLKRFKSGAKPLNFLDWREQEYNNRFEAMIGFNTKQPWLYDNIRDVYIDPPAEVLDSLPDWREDSEKTEEALLEICKSEPDWLFDREYWYDDEDFEI